MFFLFYLSLSILKLLMTAKFKSKNTGLVVIHEYYMRIDKTKPFYNSVTK